MSTALDLAPGGAGESEFAIARMAPESLSEILEANLGGGGGLNAFDLDQVRVPAGGGQQWEVPGLDGPQSAKEVSGIVVAWRSPRGYWSQSIEDSGGGAPPDCQSADGIEGIGVPGGPCARCPMNAWNSDPKGGKGKACKETRQIFLIRGSQRLPLVVRVPPSSIGNVRQYFLRLASEELPFYGVVTRFSLGKAKSGQGITYAEVLPTLERRLAPDEVHAVRAYSQAFNTALASVAVDRADTEPFA